MELHAESPGHDRYYIFPTMAAAHLALFKGLGPRFSMMNFENLDVRFAILEVTESLLVVTAGFPMVQSCYGLSREVWATSRTHFPDMVAHAK